MYCTCEDLRNGCSINTGIISYSSVIVSHIIN